MNIDNDRIIKSFCKLYPVCSESKKSLYELNIIQDYVDLLEDIVIMQCSLLHKIQNDPNDVFINYEKYIKNLIDDKIVEFSIINKSNKNK